MAPDNIQLLSLRKLKVFLCLAETRSVKEASRLLLRTRTAVSKSLSDFEKQLGVTVFERTAEGYIPTSEGEVLLSRAKVIEKIFFGLAKSYQAFHKRPRNINTIPLLKMDIATKRLIHLSLLSDAGSVDEAAKLGSLSTSAIYKSVHELERLLDLPLFVRLPNGRIIPINFGEVLCQQVKLVLSQLRHALNDIKTIRGKHEGLLRIGCLPSMLTYVLPISLAKLAITHPEIGVNIDSRPYTEMEKDLFNGDLDVIIGGTMSGSQTVGLKTEVLAEDHVYLVVGAHHPLAGMKVLSKADLKDVDWVLPHSGTPSREIFMKCLNDSGIYPEKIWIEAGSTTALRGILMSSKAVMTGTKYQTHYEQGLGLLKLLPFPLAHNSWPLGLTLRHDAPPPNSFEFFLDCLRKTLIEIQEGVTLEDHGWKSHPIIT